MATATTPNQCWSLDFLSDKLADGRSFRILTVVDQFTWECVLFGSGSRCDRDASGAGATKSEGGTKAFAGQSPPTMAPEFCSRALEAWVMEHDVQLCFIQPSRPVKGGCGAGGNVLKDSTGCYST